jgi:hypothetical protein
MRLSWEEFIDCFDSLQLDPAECVPAEIWRYMDRGLSGWVSIRDFDRRAFDLLAGFRLWVSKVFSSLDVMYSALTSKATVSTDVFVSNLSKYCVERKLPITASDVSYIIAALATKRGELRASDFDFLARWEVARDLQETQVFSDFSIKSDGESTTDWTSPERDQTSEEATSRAYLQRGSAPTVETRRRVGRK